MKKLNALGLAAVVTVCAASAFAAPAKEGVKDPDTGITLYPPKHDTNASPGTRQQKFAAEVKAAMQRVATASKKAANRADQALHDVVHSDKA